MNRPPPWRGGKIPSPGGTPQGGLSCPSGNSPSGGPEGVGRGMRAETRKSVQRHRPTFGLVIVPWSRPLRFRSSGVTARIPLQSEKRSFGTAFLTASPRGKRFSASRRAGQCSAPIGPFWHTGGHREAVGGGSAACPTIFMKNERCKFLQRSFWVIRDACPRRPC